MVYAVNDRNSFNNVTEWLHQINENQAETVPKLLVGNKSDQVSERVVSFEEGRLKAIDFKCLFMECSAKENINVDEMFLLVGKEILK